MYPKGRSELPGVSMHPKSQLWNLLLRKEQAAFEIVAKEAGLTFVRVGSEGKDALALLNRSLDKSKTSRLKYYTANEISTALSLVEGPLFAQQLVAMLREKNSAGGSSEDGRRRDQLAQDDKKRRLQEKLEALWRELEDAGAFVQKLEPHGREVGFKLTTPIATYLDYARPKDILKLVKQDMETARQFCCHFCAQPLDCTARDGAGILACSGCGAWCGSIPTNLAMRAVGETEQRWGWDGLQVALAHWDSFFAICEQTGWPWLRMSLFEENRAMDASFSVMGPAAVETTEVAVPLMRYSEWEDDETIFPTCALCRHCATLQDMSGSFDVEEHYCLYPYEPNRELVDDRLFIEPEHYRWYESHAGSIIRNRLLRAWFGYVVCVSRQTRELEALFSEVNGGFQGPICARFSLLDTHTDLEENGGSCRIIGTTKATFGVLNLRAHQEEKHQAERVRQIALLKQKLSTLKESPEHIAFFTMRVEMGPSYHSERKQLIDYLTAQFSADELRILAANSGLHSRFNMSNRAAVAVLQGVLARSGRFSE
jgi:ribosomal protein L37AE/L43A